MRILRPLVAFVLVFAAVLSVGAQENDKYPVKVTPLVSQDGVRPGDSFAVALEFAMQGKFHIYGPAENDGTPTQVEPAAVAGLSFGEPVYPPTGEMDVFGQKIAVYEKTIHVVVPAQAAADAKPGTTLTVKLRATYAACDDKRCLPPQMDRAFEVTVPIVAPGTPVKPLRPEVFPAVAQGGAGEQPAGGGAQAGGAAKVAGVPDDYPLRVDAFVSQELVRPGDRFLVAVEFVIEEPYHLYGPKSEGTPTAVKGVAGGGFSAGETIYPEPHEVTIFDAPTQVYEKTVHVLVPVTAAGDLAPGPATVRLEASFAACTDRLCLDPVDRVEIQVPVTVAVEGAAVKKLRPEVFGAATTAGNGGTGGPAGSGGPAGNGGAKGTETQVPAQENGPAGDGGAKNGPAGNGGVPAGGPAAGNGGAPGDFGAAGNGGAEPAPTSAADIDRMGFVLAMLTGLAWGIGAGLSPCVYPMIPVTLAYFGTQGGQSRGKTLGLAFVYVAGIVVTYATLGLIVGRAGEDLGAYAANPYVVAVVVAVFLAMSLSMFGLYEIRLPSSITSKLEDAGSQRGGFAGTFILGLVLGFVAAPCVGPFAGALIISAATKPAVEGFLMLSSFGFGMGLPLLFIAVFSATLPKPGMWMVKLKCAFGFLILGMAVYFTLPLSPRYIPEWVLYALAGAIGMSFATFVGAFSALAPDAGIGRVLIKTLGILAALFAGFAFLAGLNQLMPLIPRGTAAAGATTGTEAKIAWVRDFEEGMALAAKEKKPVYLDFTADW